MRCVYSVNGCWRRCHSAVTTLEAVVGRRRSVVRGSKLGFGVGILVSVVVAANASGDVLIREDFIVGPGCACDRDRMNSHAGEVDQVFPEVRGWCLGKQPLWQPVARRTWVVLALLLCRHARDADRSSLPTDRRAGGPLLRPTDVLHFLLALIGLRALR